jgi:hypothetical protein
MTIKSVGGPFAETREGIGGLLLISAKISPGATAVAVLVV